MKKLYHGLEVFEKLVMSGMFLFLSLAIVVEVIMRKFLSNGFPWLEELCRYAFIIATFVGTSVAVTGNEHPKMTALYSALGEKKIFLVIGADVICLALFAWLFPYSIKQVGNMIRMGTQTSTLGIPLWCIYAAIPLCLGGMILRYVSRLVQNIKALLRRKK